MARVGSNPTFGTTKHCAALTGAAFLYPNWLPSINDQPLTSDNCQLLTGRYRNRLSELYPWGNSLYEGSRQTGRWCYGVEE